MSIKKINCNKLKGQTLNAFQVGNTDLQLRLTISFANVFYKELYFTGN